jgi:hypothetical protein
MNRRAIASKVKAQATEAGRAFAFRFFLRYGDDTDATLARESAIAKQFFHLAAGEVLARHQCLDEADRRLLTDYAMAAVEVAFAERVQALAATNAGGARFDMEWSHGRMPQAASPV